MATNTRVPAQRGHSHPKLEQNVQNASYTLVQTDEGKLISKQSGGAGESITIPSHSGATGGAFDPDAFDTDAFEAVDFEFSGGEAGGVPFDIGTMIAIDNDGGGALTITILDDTLVWAADGTTGDRSLADGGVAVLLKIATTKWKIIGDGLS